MFSPTNHPTQHQLSLFSQGLLEDGLSIEIERHISSCASCTEKLCSIGADGGFVDLVVKAVADAPHEETIAFESGDGRSVQQNPKVASREFVFDASGLERYEIISELGRGGMGVVYLAKDAQLQRKVALKVIRSADHASSEDIDRFRQEAELVASLQHPGIVQIYEVGQTRGTPYLALEYVDGVTLADYTNGQEQPYRWSATMLLQLTKAMEFAHQSSVIHRDLKPTNVLVKTTQDGNSDATTWSPRVSDGSGKVPQAVPIAKITDFGLGKKIDENSDLTKTGFALGTPSFMSPEQAIGNSRTLGPSTDVYSLGAILYFLLTGQAPFDADEVLVTIRQVLDEEPTPPRKLVRSIPKPLETICLKCLRKEPSSRYASTGELATDLERFLQGDPILAKPLNIAQRTFIWARRRPLAATAVIMAFALMGLHLTARFIFQQPWHNGAFKYIAPSLIVGWTLGMLILESLSRRHHWRDLEKYGYVLLSVITFTTVFHFDMGPRSGPVPMYVVSIVISVLALPNPKMVWFTTLLSMLAYGILFALSFYTAPQNLVSGEAAAGLLLSLFITGLALHLLLRRSLAN